jgi:SAM-dependent methyltransferase
MSATSSSSLYNELWTTAWGDMQHSGPVHRHTMRFVARTVRELGVRTVLDVGCGGGDNLAVLARTGDYELAGVDISSQALEYARRRVPTAQLSELDVQRETLEQRFDLVMSIQVIEHLHDDVGALRHMAEMTSRYLLVSTMCGRMRPSEREIGHLRNYTRDELRRKIESAGLAVVWIRGWGFPFFSPLVRSTVEYLPGGPPTGAIGRKERLASAVLFNLYRCNVPTRGDVVSVLARVRT